MIFAIIKSQKWSNSYSYLACAEARQNRVPVAVYWGNRDQADLTQSALSVFTHARVTCRPQLG